MTWDIPTWLKLDEVTKLSQVEMAFHTGKLKFSYLPTYVQPTALKNDSTFFNSEFRLVIDQMLLDWERSMIVSFDK